MFRIIETSKGNWILQKWYQDRWSWIIIAEFKSLEEANIYCDLHSILKDNIPTETYEDFLHSMFSMFKI